MLFLLKAVNTLCWQMPNKSLCARFGWDTTGGVYHGAWDTAERQQHIRRWKPSARFPSVSQMEKKDTYFVLKLSWTFGKNSEFGFKTRKQALMKP